MSSDDQHVWLEAAFGALRDVPIALLEKGALAACSVDHPSKIVGAIKRAIDDDWSARRRYASAPSINWDAQRGMEAAIARLHARQMSQDEFDALPEQWRRVAETQGAVRADMTVRFAPF